MAVSNRVRATACLATQRFGYGARPGELASVATDPRGWLTAQLERPPAPVAAIDALPSSRELLVPVQEAIGDGPRPGGAGDARIAARIGRVLKDQMAPAYRAQVQARVTAAVESPEPMLERLTHFWANHFAVSVDKPATLGLAGTLEFEAIRPKVSGYFSDLLLAVVQHPAMITYLDNQRSIGPGSRLARLAARRRPEAALGLNENLAREVLELHTLGVDGGYGQDDVEELARALSGWSVGGGAGRLATGEPGRFAFRAVVHEPGARHVLGRRYGEGGLDQGERILRDLSAHPATARFIATKLARHFVADRPAPELIERLARRYLDTQGWLPAVHAELVAAPEAWAADTRKLKTPNDFILSSLRALDVVPRQSRVLAGSFQQLGQRVWGPGSPSGWPDTAEYWGSADGLLKRIEWAGAAAERVGGRVDPVTLGDAVLGDGFDDHSRLTVSRAESSTQGLTLLLMSPAFQWR